MPIPVSLSLGALESFIEVPLEQGSDFLGLEMQRVSFPTGESGLIAKLQHWDKSVDLYFEPHLPVTHTWFATDPAYAHATLGDLWPTEFGRSVYVTTPAQVRLDVSFRIRSGATVECRVNFDPESEAPAQFTPTPPSANPPNLRLLETHGFRYLPRSRSVVEFAVNNIEMSPATLVLPQRIATHWSARSCTSCTLAAVNGDMLDTRTVGADSVAGPNGYFETSFGTSERFDPTARFTQSGEFFISCGVGVVTAGSWEAIPASGAWDVRLTHVSQDWFPGMRKLALVPVWAARKLRRRGENWSWQGQFEEGDWNHTGTWKV